MQIDEEELYSAVARGEAIIDEDNCKIDAANNATFGDTEASGAGATDGNNGAVGRAPGAMLAQAWLQSRASTGAIA